MPALVDQIRILEQQAQDGRDALKDLEKVRLLMGQVAEVARALGVPGADAAPDLALSAEQRAGYERRIAELEAQLRKATGQPRPDRGFATDEGHGANARPARQDAVARAVSVGMQRIVTALVEGNRIHADDAELADDDLIEFIADAVDCLLEDLDCQKARAEAAESPGAPEPHQPDNEEPTLDELSALARAKRRKADALDAKVTHEHGCPTCGAEAGYCCNFKTSRMIFEGLTQAHDARRALSSAAEGRFVVARTNTKPTRRTVFWNAEHEKWGPDLAACTFWNDHAEAEKAKPRMSRVLSYDDARAIADDDAKFSPAATGELPLTVDAIKQQITSALNAQQEG